MNKNVELINYIDVAETVYERVYENNKISNNLIVNLNRIMAEIKNQAAEKRLKLKYSQIIIKPIQWCNELFRTF